MEMERINENTIRVSIGNEDLAARGITFLDLLGNQKQIESFFYSILEEVDVEDQFQETDSVTFQVLPNKDGLELFISKNLPMGDPESLGMLSAEEGEGFSDFLKQHLIDQGATELAETDELLDEEIDFIETDMLNTLDTVFRLENFEAFITLGKHVTLHNVVTSLYHFKGDYYLQVTFLTDESTETDMCNDVSQLYEFSYKTSVSADVLEEYGKIVMKQNALEMVRYYF